MSYESRLQHALSFYYKLSTRYIDGINLEGVNEGALQTIVSRGYDQLMKFPGICKKLCRYFDYMSAYGRRQKFRDYPFLYYEDTLRCDIAWLNYYINGLMKDGPKEYASHKQSMRNLFAQLNELHQDIKASYTFKQEKRQRKSEKRQAEHYDKQQPKYARLVFE